MYPEGVTLFCNKCNNSNRQTRYKCSDCKSILHWRCENSNHTGVYGSYYKHKESCGHCNLDGVEVYLEKKAQKKENRNREILNIDKNQMPWCKWKNNEAMLHIKTGLSHEDISTIFYHVGKYLIDYRRKHIVHAEDHYCVSPHNMLVLTLHWLFKYPSFYEIYIEYQVPRTTMKRVLLVTLDLLHAYFVPKLIQPLQASSPTSSYSSLSNVKSIVDSTFLPLPKGQYLKELYHPKSPTKTALKYELACNMNYQIVNVSEVYVGSAADIAIARQTGILWQLNKESKAIGDKGYYGSELILTHAKRGTKRKKAEADQRRTRTKSEKSRELESQRSAIEQINKRIKDWTIMRGVYRGEWNEKDFVGCFVRVVAALLNLCMSTHPIRQGELDDI